MNPGGRLDDLRARTDQMLLLAGLTWKEGVRRRTILMGFLLTVAFVALYGVGTYYAFRQFDAQPDSASMGGVGALGMTLDPDFYRDMAAYQMLSFGLFVSSFLAAMLVVFLGAGMISGDAENGTLQTIVTRPVDRVQVLLGRFLGYASVLVVYTILLSGSLLLLTRVFSGYAPPHPVQALLLLLMQGLIVLGIVALATSTLPQIATGITGLMLFGVAFIGGIVEQIGMFLRNDTAAAIGDAVHYLAPTDSFFRMALGRLTPGSMAVMGEFLTGPFGAPKGVEVGALLYGLLYLGACLVGAAVLFRRRDL